MADSLMMVCVEPNLGCAPMNAVGVGAVFGGQGWPFLYSVLDEGKALKCILDLQEMCYEPVLVLAWMWGHE